jgi:DNA-binding transcriptional ArsR family regulator
MTDEMRSAEAGGALAEIRNRQQQVIDLATVPTWYWWAVGTLMVILAVGVDTRTPVAIGLTVSAFVIGMLVATGMAVRTQFRDAQLRKGLLDGRGVVAILGFVALIIGISLGTAFALRAAGVSYPPGWRHRDGTRWSDSDASPAPDHARQPRRLAAMTTARFDDLIHAPTRLAIVSLLAASEWADFKFVRDTVGLSDSALSKQLATLEQAGYVEIRRGFVGKRPRTSARLTLAGRGAFEQHVKALQEMVARSGASIVPR